MSRREAIVQYGKALKEGRRCYRECVSSGRYPYPQVLDEILQDADTQGTVELGEVEYGEVEIGHEAKIRLLPPSAQSCVEACRSVAIRVTQAVRCEPTP